MLDSLKRYTEAEAAYRKAIELDPKDEFVWLSLGYVLGWHLKRPAEAENAYRKAVELNPADAYAVASLGELLTLHLNRQTEGEAAYRKAIELDPNYVYAWAGLGSLLATQNNRTTEARACGVKALSLEPDDEFARLVFNRSCADHVEDWRAVLPTVATWCAANPKNTEVFDFTVEGFLKLAQLTKPTNALALLDALPNSAPFETLRDAFRAHADREHLNRLAPERRVLAIELLKRLSTQEESNHAMKAPSDGQASVSGKQKTGENPLRTGDGEQGV